MDNGKIEIKWGWLLPSYSEEISGKITGTTSV